MVTSATNMKHIACWNKNNPVEVLYLKQYQTYNPNMCWKEKIIASLNNISTHKRNICLILFCHPSKLQQGHSWHFHQINLVRWPTTSNHFLTCVEIKTLQQDNCPLWCTLKTENIKVIHFLNFLTFSPFRDGIERYRFFCWVFSIFLDFF